MAGDLRFCFIGDSFVHGTRDDTCLGWVGRVAAELRRTGLDVTAYNLGIRRDTSAEIRARWQDEARRRLPATCDGRLVFSFGVNDCVLESGRVRQTLAETLANTEHILATARAWLPTLLVGPPPVALTAHGPLNQRIQTLSDALAALCAAHRVPYLPLFATLHADPAWSRELAGDGAHPTAGGYELLAGIVLGSPVWQAWQAAVLRP